MPIIALEGIDGAGKSTQSHLLHNRLSGLGLGVRKLHFPRLEAPLFGELIGDFLRGDLGPKEGVDPRLVALLYAGDRWGISEELQAWRKAGDFVILDRYYASNLAYQGAKLPPGETREQLLDWIVQMELQHLKVPEADLTLYLRAPQDFAEKTLTARQGDEQRDYLRGKMDVHEMDLSFQREVKGVFETLGNRIPHYEVVECQSEGGNMRTPSAIHESIWRFVEALL